MFRIYMNVTFEVQDYYRQLRHGFRERFDLPSLSFSLEQLDIRNSEQVALIATDRAASVFSSPEDIERMSFLFALTFHPPPSEYDDEMTRQEDVVNIINRRFAYASSYSISHAKYMIYGILRALRSLPLRNYPLLYAGTGSEYDFEPGDMISCQCFPFFAKDIELANTMRMQDAGGEEYGTIFIAKDLKGYDVSEYFENPVVIVEPCTKFVVTHVITEDIYTINVEYVESEFFLGKRIPAPPIE